MVIRSATVEHIPAFNGIQRFADMFTKYGKNTSITSRWFASSPEVCNFVCTTERRSAVVSRLPALGCDSEQYCSLFSQLL
jgi:hypothetical protein